MKCTWISLLLLILTFQTLSNIILPDKLPNNQDSSQRQPVPDLNCKVKSNDGGCSECFQGFYFSKIERVCKVVNSLCKSWNDDGECLSCYPGYSLFRSDCSTQILVAAQSEWKDPNCFTYQNGKCKSCSTRFYFNQDKICTNVSPYCRTWNSVTGACESCFDGYFLNKSQCSQSKLTSNIVYIQNCAQYYNNLCIKCAFRYYFAGQACRPVSDLCSSWDSSNGLCTSCYAGYQLIGGKCLLQDPFCTMKSGHGCLQCADRYYLNLNSFCQVVSPLCKSYDPLYGTCTGCYDNFQLSQGSCLVI